MAQLTLLQIVDAVTGELGLVSPGSVVGTNDLQTQQLLRLVNRSGDTIKRVHNWTVLQNLFTLNVGAPLLTTGTTLGGSPIISNIPTTAAITAGTFVVTGSNIPVAARVLSVDSITQITMDMVTTGTGTTSGVTLTFSKDTYPEPTLFDRFINGTGWDRTNRWQLIGPDSPQMDEYHRSGIVTTGPRRHFRQVGSLAAGTYRLWPPPQTIDTPFQIAWEYVTLGWCQSASGTMQTSMQADTDVPLLDSQAIILDVKWRFLEAKGIPTAASMQSEAQDYIMQLIARDGGAPTLNAGRRFQPYLIGSWQVPDGNWPGGTP
jgi:hypothetical protein